MVVDILERYALRERVQVIASGKLVKPTDVGWALCVGADFAVSARGFMFALGCIKAMLCHKDTRPTGITTHNPRCSRARIWPTSPCASPTTPATPSTKSR